jgi:hypothetical protein
MVEINNPKNREKFSKLGKIQANKFSWDNTAKSVLKVFEKIKSRVLEY